MIYNRTISGRTGNSVGPFVRMVATLISPICIVMFKSAKDLTITTADLEDVVAIVSEFENVVFSKSWRD